MHISAIDHPALITDLVSISADRLNPLRGIPRLSERLSFGIRNRASMRFAAVFETRITAPAVGEEYSRSGSVANSAQERGAVLVKSAALDFRADHLCTDRISGKHSKCKNRKHKALHAKELFADHADKPRNCTGYTAADEESRNYHHSKK